MSMKQTPFRSKAAIQQTRNVIHRSWSHEEQERRRWLAATQQERLFNMLFPKRAAVPARVA